MKKEDSFPEVDFKHYQFEENDSFQIDAFNYNCLLFLTKGRVVRNIPFSDPIYYNTGDILFFPISLNTDLKFLTSGDLLCVYFNNTVNTFRELQSLLISNEPVEMEDYLGQLKIKYPLSFYITLAVRYVEDGVMNETMAVSKLSELFILLRKYYGEEQIRILFRPLLSTHPEFKLLVFSKFKYTYNVDELADACNMRKRAFERKFKETFFGEPPYSWLQSQKERKILSMMAIPGISAADIVTEFNFYDSSHLNKFCRGRFGKTPEEIIKMLSN